MPNTNPLKQIVIKQKKGEPVGIYSCCSANDYVIEAALEKAKRDNSCVLIEATDKPGRSKWWIYRNDTC